MTSCAILIVNGFDRAGRWGEYNAKEALRYPWIQLCMRQIEAHTTPGRYQVLIWDNVGMAAQRRDLRAHRDVRVMPHGRARIERGHPTALDLLVRETKPEAKYIVTLDTDAFPIRDGWIEQLIAPLEAGSGVSGIYRDELAPYIRPFIHPSCLCARREDLLSHGVSFRKGPGQDIGQHLSEALSRHRGSAPLCRSNVRNPHFLMGGLYGDLIYHHGAGSRRPRFWGHPYHEGDEVIRSALIEAAFNDLTGLVTWLRGERNGGLAGLGQGVVS
jgi:hypothetical protein